MPFGRGGLLGTGRVTGPFNHAGDLAPLTSPWGQLLFRNTTVLIDQPPAIGHQSPRGFGGTFGVMATRSANVQALFAPGGYYGDAPPDQLQPTVPAAPPWQRR